MAYVALSRAVSLDRLTILDSAGEPLPPTGPHPAAKAFHAQLLHGAGPVVSAAKPPPALRGGCAAREDTACSCQALAPATVLAGLAGSAEVGADAAVVLPEKRRAGGETLDGGRCEEDDEEWWEEAEAAVRATEASFAAQR